MANPQQSMAAATGGGAIPSLDGVRALAVGLVFFAHGGLQNIVPGGLGVTAFFVLSGYLITTLMRQEQARDGAISLRNFYLRRCLRLMPPLFVVVALSAALYAIGWLPFGYTWNGLLSVLFYFGNYHVIFNDFHGIPPGIGVVWSLAVEEHFYLIYPPLAALMLRPGRRGLSVTLLALACALVLVRRIWLVAHGGSEDYIGMATDTRIDAILVGCIMAMAMNPWLEPAPMKLPPNPVVLAVCGAALAFSVLYRDEAFRMTLRYTIQSLAIAPLIYFAILRAKTPAFRWLGSRIPSYLGEVSYSIYLTHHLILELLRYKIPVLGATPTFILAACCSLLAAEAMRRWIERPCVALRRKLHSSKAPAPNSNTAATSAS